AAGATKYSLYYRAKGITTWTIVSASINSYNLSNLTTGTTYEWQVRTICSSGLSVFAPSITFTTSSPCGLAAGLATTGITTSAATLGWTAVSGATGYNVQYRPTGSSSW